MISMSIFLCLEVEILGRIISIANQKGGVGKTTTTVNLSAILAQKGKKVLMIDMDPQGNATSGFGIDKNAKTSVYDLIINDVEAEETMQPSSLKNLKIGRAHV